MSKRPRIFGRSSPLRRRRDKIAFFNKEEERDERRTMLEHYRAVAAEELFKFRFREKQIEDNKRRDEEIAKDQDDADRLLLFLILIHDHQIDEAMLQASLDHIDETRRADPTSRTQLRKAQRIAEELRKEMEGKTGAEKALAHIDKRAVKIQTRLDALPDKDCPELVAAE